MSFTYYDKLQNLGAEKKFVCVGLDPDLEKIPQHLKNKYSSSYEIIFNFLTEIVDSTGDLVCAFKPNAAFYEQYASDGEKALTDIIEYIHQKFPEVVVIGDFKRGDIGNTNIAYAKSAFEVYNVDAITLSPYLGSDTLEAFNKYEEKGLILLCRTSNPGSNELQEMPINIQAANEADLLTTTEAESLRELTGNTVVKLYELVAFLAQNRWNKNNNLSLVVGATHPEVFANVRKLAPTLPFLIPGIGTQGGSLEETLKYAPDTNRQGFIINSSSGIIYASKEQEFAQSAKDATLKLTREISQFLMSSRT